VLICASCGQENPDGFRFCGACAAPLATDAAAPREERKIVTVLFADLVGFTARAERLDPEDVRALLAPYHARLRQELERFGGTVEKFIGDAVMALFGAPVAHEDDPERAVRAALAIRDWIAEDAQGLQVRIAVNTGEALVTLDARPNEGEGMAAGDVVNAAARMQAAASVNGILVGEQTHRATAHVIDYREAEPVEAKGKTEVIQVWEALQPRSRLGVDLAQSVVAPLVGRQRELELLVSTLARVREERSPQLVTLVGVPGIGKSRLVYELFKTVEQNSELVTWRQGRSLPYGEGVSFWALGEMVKAQAGALESDRPDELREKLRRVVESLATDPAEDRWLLSHLASLVGLGGEDAVEEDRPGESFAAWRRFLELLAEQRPLVLVFEDLHWADDGVLDFVDGLVDWASGIPLLLLCTTRPELLERRPGWGGGKTNALTISLPPLADDDTARLLGSLLERPMLAAETQEALLAQAGGNPLYAEQYVRMLLERGRLEELPETVQGIIAARLDALSGEEKQVLQDAAVVGKVFWLGALEAIGGVVRQRAEEILRGLERKQFVQRARRPSMAGEPEYAFRHALLRDVAYGQITRATRGEKHRLAAEWLESLGRPEHHVEMLAHHYTEALEYARVAGTREGELAEQARSALRAAGDRATVLGVYAASARFYGAALELWPKDDPDRAELQWRYGRARLSTDGTGLELLAEAIDGLRAAGDREQAAEVSLDLARAYWLRGERDRAYGYVEGALALSEAGRPSRSRAHALVARSSYHMVAGEYAEALELARQAVPLVEELGTGGWRARAWDVIGTSRVLEGDAEGLDDQERAIVIAREAGAFFELHTAWINLCSSQTFLGQVGDVSRTLDALRRSVERYGTAANRRWLRMIEAGNLIARGYWNDALELADEDISEIEAGSPYYLEPIWRTFRASIRLGRGDLAGASRDAERATELARRGGESQTLAPSLATGARILIAEGRRDEAAALATEVLTLGHTLTSALVQEFGGEPLITFAWVVCDLGRSGELVRALEPAPSTPWINAARTIARGELVAAAEILEGLVSRPPEAYTRLRAAEQLLLEGRRAEAELELGRALAFYREAGATFYVAQGEALLAGTVEPAEVMRRATNR